MLRPGIRELGINVLYRRAGNRTRIISPARRAIRADASGEGAGVMFKQMLVPLDGSERAERAVPVAARMARATGGSIVLTRVVSPTSELWPGIEPQPTLTQSIIDADLADASAYLEQIADSPSLTGIPTRTVALFGPPAFTILSVALSYNADLIVMCSHGYTGMSLWMLGSVAEKVARHAAVPVFILREGGPSPITY